MPGFTGKPAGPVHTIVADSSGNLYYSDELNHSVVSLTPDGSIRWHQSERGSKPGAFRYPRGISLGVIQKEEAFIECLAVCDSWNHRVQFLDTAGNPIEAWHKAGNKPLLEPCDVRFIPDASDSTHGTYDRGYWLVLDKDNHFLSAMGSNGRLLFQIGRRFPTALQDHWAIPGMLFENVAVHPGYIREFPLFEFCFFPARILGSSEQALYIWEPRSLQLKQVLLSNFLPISSFSKNIEWMSADNSGLIGWQRDTRRLHIYSAAGRCRYEVEVRGIPVPSNLPLNEFFLQKGDCIERSQWQASKTDPDPSHSSIRYSPLRTSAEMELALRDETLIHDAVAGWVEIVDEILALTDRVESLGNKNDPRQWTRISEEIQALPDKRKKAERIFIQSIHHWSLGLLEWHFSVEDAGERAGRISTEQDIWMGLSRPILDYFARVQDGLDTLMLLHNTLSGGTPNESMTNAIAPLETELQNIREWIYQWTAVREAVTGYLPVPWIQPLAKKLPDKKQSPGYQSHRSDYRHHPPQSTPFREVNTIQLTRGDKRFNPLGLACSSGGDLYVSSHNASEILHLNPEGTILENLGSGLENHEGPASFAHLALAMNKRLWAADFSNHRIVEFDLESKAFRTLGRDGSAREKLTAPYGILARPDGSLLVTDANHCIARITSDGKIQPFFSKIGRNRAEMLEPVSFCTASDGGFWVVDRRNHRILRLNEEGTVVEEMGKCGLGEGDLFLPEAAAEFEDRAIAIAQNKYLRSIKLFSPSGTEKGKLLLNYFAPGMLVFQERLYVADMSFGSIHVYERQN
ncbi:MAG: hypothetical protein JXR49_11135 [Acidobacteria bacterium]|nr:hypothetical protein [Acidobacteriota bacterium]